jgi:hypothetical protein
MANWIAITKLDLYDAKAAALVDAADSVQLGVGQVSRSAQVIIDVTLEFRSKVARTYTLDVDPTKIPNVLKQAAVDTIVARLKISLEQELSKGEQDRLMAIERQLNRIADGKDLVDPPDNPMAAPMSQAFAQPVTGDPKLKNFRKSREDGIV